MIKKSIKELAEGFKKLEISFAKLKSEAKFRLLKLKYNGKARKSSSE